MNRDREQFDEDQIGEGVQERGWFPSKEKWVLGLQSRERKKRKFESSLPLPMAKKHVLESIWDLRTRGNWWNMNVSQTLYTQRMSKKIAKVNLEESRMKAKLSLEERKREAAMADLHGIGREDNQCMAEDLQ